MKLDKGIPPCAPVVTVIFCVIIILLYYDVRIGVKNGRIAERMEKTSWA